MVTTALVLLRLSNKDVVDGNVLLTVFVSLSLCVFPSSSFRLPLSCLQVWDGKSFKPQNNVRCIPRPRNVLFDGAPGSKSFLNGVYEPQNMLNKKPLYRKRHNDYVWLRLNTNGR